MATPEKKDEKRLTTPEFRASFAHVFKPKAGFRGSEPKYQLEALWSKAAGIDWLKKEIKKAGDEMWGAGKWPKTWKNPIKDGDEKELEGYPGNWFVTLSSKMKPGIVDGKRGNQEIINPEEFYSGCYARATVTVKAYEYRDPETKAVISRGISVYLQNLQKTKDGDPFSGRKNAKDDFEVLEELESDGNESGQDAKEFDF